MRQFKRYILVLLLGLLSHTLNAQYLGEIGVMGGVSYYNGDANSTTPFYENHPYVGGLLRLKMSSHWLCKFDLSYGAVSGDTENFPDINYPHSSSFEHSFWNVGCQFELNFFKYGMGRWDKDLKRHTPYITAGPSIAVYQAWNGHHIMPGLAFGVGYKFKVAPRFNVGVEWKTISTTTNTDTVISPTLCMSGILLLRITTGIRARLSSCRSTSSNGVAYAAYTIKRFLL